MLACTCSALPWHDFNVFTVYKKGSNIAISCLLELTQWQHGVLPQPGLLLSYAASACQGKSETCHAKVQEQKILLLLRANYFAGL